MIDVLLAGEQDFPGLLAIQHEAFARVAEEVGFPATDMPPVRETLDDLHTLRADGWRYWKALDEHGEIVGTVRGIEREGRVEVGRLAVTGHCVRQGVATALMNALETAYPDANVFELFTGYNAWAPLALYARLGYVESRRQTLPSGYELVWLEKRQRGTTAL
jgi:GNAT superfamily N-acetyltransferase